MEQLTFDRVGERMYREKLENGLTVCVFPKPEFQKGYAFFATNYGAWMCASAWTGCGQTAPPEWPTIWSTRCLTPRRQCPPGSGGQRGFPQRLHQLGPHRLLF